MATRPNRALEELANVPLSEDEQRILSEIEQQLYQSDPQLAREVGSTTVYTAALRNIRWSVLGFLVGVAVMVFTLSVHFLFSFLGFLIMLGAALVFVTNLRRLGRVGVQQVTQRLSGSTVRTAFGGASSRMRDRMRRDGDEDDDSTP